jgi:hypothetical protein
MQCFRRFMKVTTNFPTVTLRMTGIILTTISTIYQLCHTADWLLQVKSMWLAAQTVTAT